MAILVLGGSGMLGTDLRAELSRRSLAFEAPSSAEMDITDSSSVAAYMGERQLEWCLNCAAYTAVDLAETERDQAFAINALGAGYISQMCGLLNCRHLYVSTDFVFDGEASEPYPEDAPTNPLGAYGASKLAGEQSVLATGGTVVRTSWLYGAHGKSFPRTILNAWRAGRELRVVSDQIGRPTSTVDLARVLVDLVELPAPPSILHACGPDDMTWYGLACAVIEAAGGQPEVTPINTEDWPTPARRPRYSVLDTSRIDALGIAPMRDSSESLREFVTLCGS